MKFLNTILFLGASHLMTAQNVVQTFSGNNFEWKQSTSGTLFYDELNGMAGLEAPIGSDNFSIFAHSLWMSGITSEGEIRSHHQYFCQEQSSDNCVDKWGPLAEGAGFNSSELAAQYNKIWYVNRDQIDLHVSYYQCLNNPACDINLSFPGGYEMPADMLTWPAMGPDQPGYDTYLAPFVDLNGDGTYDADDGDYPNICGDFTTYMIYNNVGTQNSGENFPSLGFEIHTQVYGYNELEGAVFNTLFVKHKLINRSNEIYTDSYLGTFTDFDLGNGMDDYIGTDAQRSMYFVYNGYSSDEPSISGPGYGSDLPMQGVRYLGGPYQDDNGEDDLPYSEIYSTYANQTTGWGDGIADNERLGLYATTYFTNGALYPQMNQPAIPNDIHNILKGNWLDGMPKSYGGIGYDLDGLPTRYHYYGMTDPLLISTEGIDPQDENPEGWTEVTVENPPGDRRMVASSGPFTFYPGESTYLDYAMIFARSSDNPDLDLITLFNSYADEIVGMECDELQSIVLSDESETKRQLDFQLYPNPATDLLNVKLNIHVSGAQYRIYDLTGRLMMVEKIIGSSASLSIANLPAGIYLLELRTIEIFGVRKLVVR